MIKAKHANLMAILFAVALAFAAALLCAPCAHAAEGRVDVTAPVRVDLVVKPDGSFVSPDLAILNNSQDEVVVESMTAYPQGPFSFAPKGAAASDNEIWLNVNGTDLSAATGGAVLGWSVAPGGSASLSVEGGSRGITVPLGSPAIAASITWNISPVAKEAFAVYSADDNSFRFYKRPVLPQVGTVFEGRTVTKVYAGIETMAAGTLDARAGDRWRSPFYNASQATSVTVVDEIVAPASVDQWFASFEDMKSADLTKLDMSNVTVMDHMFVNCPLLEIISIGDTFAWVGSNCFLPTPSSNSIPGADGKWHALSDGAAYAPEDVPSNKADTYVAIPAPVPGVAVTGDPVVGSTLAAATSNLPAGFVPSYQWVRKAQSGHVDIPDPGKVTVRVTAPSDGSALAFSNEKTADILGNETPGPFNFFYTYTGAASSTDHEFSAVSSSDPIVLPKAGGYEITFYTNYDAITAGNWCSFDYSVGADEALPGANGPEYVIGESDEGSRIACEVTDATGRFGFTLVSGAVGPVSLYGVTAVGSYLFGTCAEGPLGSNDLLVGDSPNFFEQASIAAIDELSAAESWFGEGPTLSEASSQEHWLPDVAASAAESGYWLSDVFVLDVTAVCRTPSSEVDELGGYQLAVTIGAGDFPWAAAVDGLAIVPVAYNPEVSAWAVGTVSELDALGNTISISIPYLLPSKPESAPVTLSGTASLDPHAALSDDGTTTNINASYRVSPADAVPAVEFHVADDAAGANARPVGADGDVLREPVWGRYLRIVVTDSSGRHPGEVVSEWAGPMTTPFYGVASVKPNSPDGSGVVENSAFSYSVRGPILVEGQSDLSSYAIAFEIADDASGANARPFDEINASAPWSGTAGKYLRLVVSAKPPYAASVTGSIASPWYPIVSTDTGPASSTPAAYAAGAAPDPGCSSAETMPHG